MQTRYDILREYLITQKTNGRITMKYIRRKGRAMSPGYYQWMLGIEPQQEKPIGFLKKIMISLKALFCR